MIEFRHQDQHAPLLDRRKDPPLHAEALGNGAELLPHHLDAVDLGKVEADAGEELAGFAVVELLRLGNIGAVLEQQLRHRKHDAGPVDAGKRENIGSVGHGLRSVKNGAVI